MPDLTVYGRRQSSIVYDDFETMLRRVQFCDVPLTAGWDATVWNSGATTVASPRPRWMAVNTGVTANSFAILSTPAWGLHPNAGQYNQINFDKRMVIVAALCRIGSNHAQAVRRLHIKAGAASADLAARGIGIKVIDYNLWGESYGTQQGLVNLSTVMGANLLYRIVIIITPGQRIDWWVNGVNCGSQTTAAAIPTGALTIPLVSLQAANAAAGGVDCTFGMSTLQIGQEI